MIETLLQVVNGDYPFDQEAHPRSTVIVEDLEHFSNKHTLNFKKNEMKKVKTILVNESTVRLINIFEEQLSLHYIYEWVPVSLKTFIQNELKKQNYMELKELSAKLLFSKIIAQINHLTSQLIKLGIETTLAYRLLGVQSDKVKIFVDKRCRIGKKSHVFLKEYYRSQKYQLIKQLQEDIIISINKAKVSPNFTIRNNRLVFDNKHAFFPRNTRTSAINTDINSESFLMSSLNQSKDFESVSGIGDSYLLRHNLSKERKFSQPKADKQLPIKNEFINLRNSESSALKSIAKKLQTFNEQQLSQQQKMTDKKPKPEEKSYTRSKSIKIELQKSQIGKKRKDSYKMIVTTCHEYETDNLQLQDVFKHANMFESTELPTQKQKKRKSPDATFEKLRKVKQKAQSFLKNFLLQKKTSQL